MFQSPVKPARDGEERQSSNNHPTLLGVFVSFLILKFKDMNLDHKRLYQWWTLTGIKSPRDVASAGTDTCQPSSIVM